MTRPTRCNVFRPLIGAEIMDDPAATPDKVEHWFKLLADYQMPLARVFIPRGEEALQRMDGFFRAAEKYHVGITATLGGPPSDKNARWIHEVVLRYKDSPALDSWILVNEPGQSPDANPLALESFRAWLQAKYKTVETLNGVWQSAYAGFDAVAFEPQWMGGRLFARPAPFLDWHTFWRSHLTWHLGWIAEQIRQMDAVHPTHVNPHALVGNLAAMSLDLPAWRGFLDSLGSSIHPSWHFTLLKRNQYVLGVAYVCDLIRGAVEPKPFWVTELQGGNNTNSGNRPLGPTPADIAQWLWTSIGSGAERMIFWLLNNRSFGGESGEWSLLDFQDQPSERLEAAGQVARVLRQYDEFFRDAQPITAPITILLSLETMTLQERFEKTQPVTSTERGVPVRLEGRGRNAHGLAALAYYETFQQLGIPVRVKFMHDFDWNAAAEPPQLAILPNVAALSGEQARAIETFVRNGHTVLLTGLTGAWDPENRFWPLASGFPLENLLGATLKELRTLDEGCEVALQEPKVTLPSHLWVGEIRNHTAQPIGQQQSWITAVRKPAGAGQAIWIPSLVDLGAWLGDNRPLAHLLNASFASLMRELPFRFAEQEPGCLLRILRNGPCYLTVVTNGTGQARRVHLQHPEDLSPHTLWAEGADLASHSEVVLSPRGTLVTLWR
jgi:beta-galactosidase